MHVVTIETPSLGDRSYLLHDGTVGLVVDPQRDLDRLDAALAEAGVELVAVFETHIHNDYVTGGLALAERHGASYHVAAEDEVAFERVAVRDGDLVEVGALRVRAVHTPGHTTTHMSYVVSSGGTEEAVLTGGGLLYGSVGRTDLIGPEHTEELTRAQHRSAHRLVRELADDVAVLPTHGFGSFCSSGDATGGDSSTIGQEREQNQALLVQDEDTFVAELLAGLDAYPAYYAHMAPMNSAGPTAAELTPPAVVDPTELRRRVHAGEWVVDLRDRKAFAAGHMVGTINIALEDSFSTYLGWLIEWGAPLTLIGDTAQDVADAQRQLARIGIDELAGRARTEDVRAEHAGAYRVSDFDELLRTRNEAGDAITVLDARRDQEWAEGHLPGALHVPLHELLERMGEVPTDRPLWVHCAGGYRASIAASLLARAGRDVVLVDDDVSALHELMVVG